MAEEDLKGHGHAHHPAAGPKPHSMAEEDLKGHGHAHHPAAGPKPAKGR